MYPSQTSFIPVTVAIASFIEKHGFGGLYPFWYLGSTPVKYLTGPVVPGLLLALHRFLDGFSLFDLSLGLVVVAFLFSALGWGILAWMLSGRRLYGYIVSLLALLAPWHWISGFALSEVSAQVAQALTPWVLLAFAHSLTAWGPVSRFPPASARLLDLSMLLKWSIWRLRAVGSPSTLVTRGVHPESQSKDHVFDWRQAYAYPTLGFALLLLTNTVASIPAIIGLFILAIVNDKATKLEERLKRVGLVIFIGWFLTLWWYPPHYWWTLFIAPSIGGKSAVGAMISLVNLMRGFVPVILAIVVVAWGIRKKSLLDKFALSWFGVFGLLTLFRFFGDSKFWMDWTAWISEVEVGVVLLASMLIFRSVRHFKKRSTEVSSDHISHNSVSLKPSLAHNSDIKSYVKSSARFVMFLKWLPSLNFDRKFTIFYLLFTIYFVFGWFMAYQNRHFWLPRSNISQSVEFKIAKVLEQETRNWKLETGKSPIVFLSGSTAFWLNSFYDISQVRGGVDQVSQDPRWRQATLEIREGAIAQDTEKVLKALKINYIVVHTGRSQEYYHDFRYPEKFNRITSLRKIYEQEGDVIYKVK